MYLIAYNRLHVQVVVVYVLVRGPEYVRLLVLLVPTLINFNIFQKGLIVIYLQYVQACRGLNGSSTGTYYQNNRNYVTYDYRRPPTGVSSLQRVRPREYWYLFRSKNVLNLPRSLSKLSLLEHSSNKYINRSRSHRADKLSRCSKIAYWYLLLTLNATTIT